MKPTSRIGKSWLVYDMGSSAYSLSVATLFYPIFFTQFAGRGTATSSHFAIAVLLSTILVAILAPLLGAYADSRGRRNVLFKLIGWASIVGSALLAFTSEMGVWPAILMFALTNFAFMQATNFYDSYISLLGSIDKNFTGRSGAGWGLGYLGGLICLASTLMILGFHAPADKGDYTIIFVVAALFYGGFSWFVFRNLPDDLPARNSSSTLATVLKTLQQWRQHRTFFAFLAANILIVDGMTTVLYFMSVYATETLKFTIGQITLVFAIVQVVAVPATWSIGWIVRRTSEAMLLVSTCIGWMLLTVMFALGPSFNGMLVLAALGGFVVGSTPALLRAIMGMLVHPDQRAELFGFAALAGRMGTVLGPLIYLIILQTMGPRGAIMSAVPAFLIGISLIVAIRARLPANRNTAVQQPGAEAR